MTRVAAVDIGTNTIRLLIADVSDDGNITWIDRHAVVPRLGQGVDATGGLAPDAIGRSSEILARYGSIVADHRCRTVIAVATSAVRDAVNRESFLDLAERALGVRPRVISGETEAELSFAGTTGHLHDRGPFLVIDPGGGSTEFVLGTVRPDYSVSVDIGSVRLTERIGYDVPWSKTALTTARSHTDALFHSAVDLPTEPNQAFGVAGTYTSLAAMFLGLPAYDGETVHGTVLTIDDLTALTDELSSMSLTEIEAIPSMDPKRAPVMVGGAVVAERALAAAGAKHITVSERDILNGIAALAATEANKQDPR